MTDAQREQTTEERLAAQVQRVKWVEGIGYVHTADDGMERLLSEMEVLAMVPGPLRPEVFVNIDPATLKPEAAQTIKKAEWDEAVSKWIFHLDDGTSRYATEGEVREMDLWDSVRNRRPLEAPSKRPLPRHRPPRFKTQGDPVKPRLPGNVFGAPRAVR